MLPASPGPAAWAGALLEHLTTHATAGPILVGTWAAAEWAIRFYAAPRLRAGARTERKTELLRTHWDIPERQVETSVVLQRRG